MNQWWEEQLHSGAAEAAALPVLHRPAPLAPVSTSPQEWWDYARLCAHRYFQGSLPAPARVHGPVLRRGEAAMICAPLGYSRWYGGDGSYRPVSPWVIGRPMAMAAAAAVTAAVNHRRKSLAQQDAVPRWRDQSQVATIATSERILCNPGGQYQSFYYDTITEFHPDLDNWALTLAFEEDCPLHLQGLAVPVVCLWTAAALYGSDWADDPRLGALVA